MYKHNTNKNNTFTYIFTIRSTTLSNSQNLRKRGAKQMQQSKFTNIPQLSQNPNMCTKEGKERQQSNIWKSAVYQISTHLREVRKFTYKFTSTKKHALCARNRTYNIYIYIYIPVCHKFANCQNFHIYVSIYTQSPLVHSATHEQRGEGKATEQIYQNPSN